MKPVIIKIRILQYFKSINSVSKIIKHEIGTEYKIEENEFKKSPFWQNRIKAKDIELVAMAEALLEKPKKEVKVKKEVEV